jgi:hypothetical protein
MYEAEGLSARAKDAAKMDAKTIGQLRAQVRDLQLEVLEVESKACESAKDDMRIWLAKAKADADKTDEIVAKVHDKMDQVAKDASDAKALVKASEAESERQLADYVALKATVDGALEVNNMLQHRIEQLTDDAKTCKEQQLSAESAASSLREELVLAEHHGKAIEAKFNVAMQTLVTYDGVMTTLYRQLASEDPAVGPFRVPWVEMPRALEAAYLAANEASQVVFVPTPPQPLDIPSADVAALLAEYEADDTLPPDDDDLLQTPPRRTPSVPGCRVVTPVDVVANKVVAKKLVPVPLADVACLSVDAAMGEVPPVVAIAPPMVSPVSPVNVALSSVDVEMEEVPPVILAQPTKMIPAPPAHVEGGIDLASVDVAMEEVPRVTSVSPSTTAVVQPAGVALPSVDVTMGEAPVIVSAPPTPLFAGPFVFVSSTPTANAPVPPANAASSLPVDVAMVEVPAVVSAPPTPLFAGPFVFVSSPPPANAVYSSVSLDVAMEKVPPVVSTSRPTIAVVPPANAALSLLADVAMDEAPVVVSAPPPPLFSGPFVFVSAAPAKTVAGSLVPAPPSTVLAAPLAVVSAAPPANASGSLVVVPAPPSNTLAAPLVVVPAPPPSAVGAVVPGGLGLIPPPTKALEDAMKAVAVSSTSSKGLEDKYNSNKPPSSKEEIAARPVAALRPRKAKK